MALELRYGQDASDGQGSETVSRDPVAPGDVEWLILEALRPGVIRLWLVEADVVAVEAHLPRFDRLIDLVVEVRRFFCPARSEVAWTPAEDRAKRRLREELGLEGARQRVASVARRHGRPLAVPLLGLTMLSPDDDDWCSAASGRAMRPS